MLWRLRRYIRRNFKPVPHDVASSMKQKLAILYAIIGWNMFAYLIFSSMKKVFPKENNVAEYAKLLGVKQASVLKYEGVNKVDEYDIQLEESHPPVDYFSEMYGEDIKYYKYIDEQE